MIGLKIVEHDKADPQFCVATTAVVLQLEAVSVLALQIIFWWGTAFWWYFLTNSTGGANSSDGGGSSGGGTDGGGSDSNDSSNDSDTESSFDLRSSTRGTNASGKINGVLRSADGKLQVYGDTVRYKVRKSHLLKCFYRKN